MGPCGTSTELDGALATIQQSIADKDGAQRIQEETDRQSALLEQANLAQFNRGLHVLVYFNMKVILVGIYSRPKHTICISICSNTNQQDEHEESEETRFYDWEEQRRSHSVLFEKDCMFSF